LKYISKIEIGAKTKQKNKMPQTELCIQDYVMNLNKNEMEYSDELNQDVNDEAEDAAFGNDMKEYDKYYKPQTVYLCNMNGWYYEYKNKKYIVTWVMYDRNNTSFRVNIV
jgi:hypothetical protein